MRLALPTSLSGKIAAITVAGLALLAAATLWSADRAMTDNAARQAAERQETNMRVAWTVLGEYGQGFRADGDGLYLGARRLNAFYAPVDRVKALVGGTATIFRDDLRIATNVTKPDGSRAVGTRLKAGPVHDAVLGRGVAYRGQADILGKPYFVAYDPIKDAAGRVVGVLYVGIPKAEFFAPVAAIETRAALISLALAAVIALATLLTARRLFAPLEALRAVMEQLAGGDLAVEVPSADRPDDIGAMARVVVALREAAVAKDRLEVQAEADRSRQTAAARPTFWPSTRAWRRRGRATPAAASRWWRRRCGRWPNAPRARPRRSAR